MVYIPSHQQWVDLHVCYTEQVCLYSPEGGGGAFMSSGDLVTMKLIIDTQRTAT